MNSSRIKQIVLTLGLAAMAAGCSQDLDPATGASASDAAAEAAAGAFGHSSSAPGDAPSLVGRAPRDGFAQLPDRGDLVGYPAERVVRREGAYTWHRADFSEAHALAAIANGVLTFTGPGGEQLRFKYDRHVEHASGDWTWIGHVLDGALAEDAIITFGAGAVFGTIARPGQSPLSVAMQDGASWLVETDRALLGAASRAAGRYARPDFVVPDALQPPELQRLAMQSQAMAPAQAAASGTTYVDVVVGYTAGFRQLHTVFNNPVVSSRLNFLAEVANESYVNSGLDLRVRLVHTMEVNYPDATGNSESLYALTGSEGSTPDPANVDPALVPLHTARNQYGADLVMLIRRFNHPENVSCGVAWLIGGGQTQTNSGYNVFGFSVVSDGSDGGFFCEDTTFAHELGHNMGLAHDRETAQGDDGALQSDEYGRFPFSFGYRTGPADGHFYTVMAYSDDQVVGYKVFSNPRVNYCGGRQCGVMNQADNAQTLQTTAPIVASFRAMVVPVQADWVRNDLDGDGNADLVWRRSSTGQNVAWRSATASTALTLGSVPNTSWQVVGIGDFDADGAGDLVWRNAANGQNTIWLGADRNDPFPVGAVSTAWQMAGVGDFDGDGVSDLLWRNPSDGRNVLWLDGNAQTTRSLGVVGGQWNVSAVADFNGDGEDDVFWRNGVTGQNLIWRSGNKGTVTTVTGVFGNDWIVGATGDFNGDGNEDVFWRHESNGSNAVWLSADSSTQQAVPAVNPAWTIGAAGDYNGDGKADVAWRNTSTGANTVWRSANPATSQGLATITDQSWQMVP